ncbi:hypothetical protein ACFQJD_17815 [Haloplanus sp. GCM10025708]|uniref:hypothetical protein n=1 Tax=Haloferacaceae TaxID=1644056 RepID=UPI0036147079
MKPTRFSLLVFFLTRRYLDTAYDWDRFDIEEWSRNRYEWTQDPWNGLNDFVQEPATTIETGTGDCDDYALVAASWATAVGRDGVGLGLCGRGPRIRHMIAFDADRSYSSGDIYSTGPGAYLDRSEYTWIYTRRIDG